MKNIYDILSAMGVEIPEDKKADFDKEIGENYKTVADYNKQVAKRDEYLNSLNDVQGKLDAVNAEDIEGMKSSIATLTQQLADEKAGRQADAAKAERDRLISEFFSGKKFVNGFTEKALKAALAEELAKDDAKGKSVETIFDGLITGEDGKKADDIFVKDDDPEPENGQKAVFTTKKNGGAKGGKVTADEFKAMSLDERVKLKKEQPDLYETLKKG